VVVRSCKSAWPRGAVAGTKGCTIPIPSDTFTSGGILLDPFVLQVAPALRVEMLSRSLARAVEHKLATT